MAELEHVVKTFSLLEAAEKEQPFLTREQKQDLYRIAFHKESMEEVEKIILQLQAPHAGKEEKERGEHTATPDGISPTSWRNAQRRIFFGKSRNIDPADAL